MALLQPKRQPPAIQIETSADKHKRSTLFEKNELIPVAEYSSGAGLSSFGAADFEPQMNTGHADTFYLRTRRLSAARIRIVIKTQHFRNGSIASLRHREKH